MDEKDLLEEARQTHKASGDYIAENSPKPAEEVITGLILGLERLRHIVRKKHDA